jgi:hypothetical protein
MAAQRFFGVAPSAMEGQSIEQLPFDGELQTSLARNVRGVAQKRKGLIIRAQQVRLDGASRVFDLHFTPLSAHRNDTQGVLIVFSPVDGSGIAAPSGNAAKKTSPHPAAKTLARKRITRVKKK